MSEVREREEMSPGAVAVSREQLAELGAIIFANVVMAAEIPAPTGGEQRLTRFLSDRFTECRLNDIAQDQAGNIAGLLPGLDSDRNLLLIAHVDKIWPEGDDHTVSVRVGEMSGRGIADNSLGVAALATLPIVLEKLGIQLRSNLILLGTTKSFGRGDLGGIRFFLKNSTRKFSGALCLEGMDLGRLSFSSLGMARGEIHVEMRREAEPQSHRHTGAIGILNRILDRLSEIDRRYQSDVTFILGSVEAISGYSVPPASGSLRFEIRSEDPGRVLAVEKEIIAVIDTLNLEDDEWKARLEIIARRKRGDLGSGHPLVGAAREAMAMLDIEPRVEPSVSELAALLDEGIPALTLGMTRGANRHSPRESIELEPIFDGLAQLVSVLRFMDTAEEELP